jgi:hypothetical protein
MHWPSSDGAVVHDPELVQLPKDIATQQPLGQGGRLLTDRQGHVAHLRQLLGDLRPGVACPNDQCKHPAVTIISPQSSPKRTRRACTIVSPLVSSSWCSSVWV